MHCERLKSRSLQFLFKYVHISKQIIKGKVEKLAGKGDFIFDFNRFQTSNSI